MLDFLVMHHEFQQCIRINSRDRYGQADGGKQCMLPMSRFCIDSPKRLSQPRCTEHSDRYRFAVQQLAVATDGFQGVGERVTVIQDSSYATCLALIGLDDVGLQSTAARYNMADCIVVLLFEFVDVIFKIAKKIGVLNNTVFDDLRETRNILSIGQAAQHVCVDKDRQRLPEGRCACSSA